MRHVISALVENKAGVLAHISGLFSSRGYNIDCLSVGITENPDLSRLTLVTRGDDAIIEQIRKQLEKLIPVLKVTDLSAKPHVEREFLLVRINAPAVKRNEVIGLVEVFRANVVDVSPNEMMIEMAGSQDKVEAFVELIKPYGIKEIARTGTVGLPRGAR